MTSAAKPLAALRPYLPADAPMLAEIFRASITELAAEDYSEAQRAAWAESADDEDAFAARLAGALTLVATIEGAAVGFASLRGAEIDMLTFILASPGRASAQCCATRWKSLRQRAASAV